MRAQCARLVPWVPPTFGKTYPLVPAVTRVVVGLERRAPHVCAQARLRVMMLVRGQAPSVVAQAPVRAEQQQQEGTDPWRSCP